MKLNAPCPSVDFQMEDMNGDAISLASLHGKPIILSFFRDAGCPFCNLRVFEFTKRFKEWDKLGIEVIAVFSSSPEEVKQFVTKNPRPFRTIADPDLELYKQYGLKSSVIGFIRGLLLRIPQARAGRKAGAKIDLKNPNATLLPADFLIGFDGRVVDLYYGKDVGDHMPIKRIESFVNKVKLARVKRESELRQLKMQKRIAEQKEHLSESKVSKAS